MKAQRNTVQRQIVLDVFRSLDDHPSVEDVYRGIQKTHPQISKNTVYRNLRLLADNGEIRRLSLPDDQERYDASTHHHYHFQCRSCGFISDIKTGNIASCIEKSIQDQRFTIEEYEVIFKGICDKCEKSHKFIKQEG